MEPAKSNVNEDSSFSFFNNSFLEMDELPQPEPVKETDSKVKDKAARKEEENAHWRAYHSIKNELDSDPELISAFTLKKLTDHKKPFKLPHISSNHTAFYTPEEIGKGKKEKCPENPPVNLRRVIEKSAGDT